MNEGNKRIISVPRNDLDSSEEIARLTKENESYKKLIEEKEKRIKGLTFVFEMVSKGLQEEIVRHETISVLLAILQSAKGDQKC
jgi:hypothetical protein